MILVYALILIIVVLLFLGFKNTENLKNPPVPGAIQLNPNTDISFVRFQTDFTNKCQPYSSMNDINGTLNIIAGNSVVLHSIEAAYSKPPGPNGPNNTIKSILQDGNINAQLLKTNPNIIRCINNYTNPRPELKHIITNRPSDVQDPILHNKHHLLRQCSPYNSQIQINNTIDDMVGTINRNMKDCVDAYGINIS